MKHLKVRINSETKNSIKNIALLLALTITLLPLFIYSVGKDIFNLQSYYFMMTSSIGALLFITISSSIYLASRFSPIKSLKIRKKLILFTEQLTKQTNDGNFKHSVEWHYKVTNDKIIIELFSSGLVYDKSRLAIQLTEYLRENLLNYEELNDCVKFEFGNLAERLNAREVLENAEL